MKTTSVIHPYKQGYSEYVTMINDYGQETHCFVCHVCGDPCPDYMCPRCGMYVCKETCSNEGTNICQQCQIEATETGN